MADYIVHKAVEHSSLSAKAAAELEKTAHWVLSPKYDGCHVVFLFADGVHISTLSRTGERVRSMDHIGQDLLDIYPLSLGTDKVAICGEAWIPGKEFNEISGMFRRHAPQPSLWFVPFDITRWESASWGSPKLNPAGNDWELAGYSQRIGLLGDQPPRAYHRVIQPRYVLRSGTFSEVMPSAVLYAKEHKTRTDSFFDGAVLAKANGVYSVGAGKGGEFIKVKPLLSETVGVTGYFTDTGAKTGKATGGLIFELNGKEQRVATGLTQAQVEDLVSFIGKRIEVEAMGLTVNGFLREPRFKGIRDDT